MPLIPDNATIYPPEASPDPRPGDYYVTIVDGRKYLRLAGPYRTHAEALAQVTAAAEFVDALDPQTWFAAFGTARVMPPENKQLTPGLLHKYGFPLPPQLQEVAAKPAPKVKDRTCATLDFDEWMAAVDRWLETTIGIGSKDLPDRLYRDAYDGGEDAYVFAREGLAEAVD